MSTDIEKVVGAFAAHPGVGTVDHTVWDNLLKAHVRQDANGLDRVDYVAIAGASSTALASYLDRLCAVDVGRLTWAEQFAFWCNLYNGLTVKVVADHYPVRSIKDIALGGSIAASLTGGPWKAKLANVGDMTLSLDDIEHTILRGVFKDPRLHYAINCASVGCPNIGTEALIGSRLDEQLDRAARAFINGPRGARIESGKLVLSGIFKWYRRDFGGDERAVLAHIARFASPAVAERMSGKTVHDYPYDWRLNDIDSL